MKNSTPAIMQGFLYGEKGKGFTKKKEAIE
ncbi:hypothetical protein SAMN05443094_11049 [Domibacillus enclensis]|uniref:Uncharacterized protein n=1 Tax=Domibacillus enclensis TaxID=1017273 RepID=A0A1N7BS53_9BACI|nr:hypothetical protein SAMN05443094_11049 [Domibacillus enclensis]